MGNWLRSRAMINDVSLMAESAPQNCNQVPAATNTPAPNYQANSTQSMSRQSLPFYYQAPYPSALLVSQLAEEEQIKIAKRIGLIQHLPTGIYDGGGSSKTVRECVICMIEFSKGDSIRFLPCLHTYHMHCIDEWLVRSFICPSCMEPVDITLLSTF